MNSEPKYTAGDEVELPSGRKGVVTQVWKDDGKPIYWVEGEDVCFFYPEDQLSSMVPPVAQELEVP